MRDEIDRALTRADVPSGYTLEARADGAIIIRYPGAHEARGPANPQGSRSWRLFPSPLLNACYDALVDDYDVVSVNEPAAPALRVTGRR